MNSARLRCLGGAAVLACLAVARRADAQQRPGLDMSTYRPSTDPNASLVLEPAATPGDGVLTLGAYGQYSFHPVSLRTPGGNNVALRPVVDQLSITPIANFGVGERLAFGGSLPLIIHQDGQHLPASVSDSQSTPSTAIGDLGLHGKLAVIRNEQGGFGLSVLGLLTLPTGNRNGFVGESGPTVSGRLLAEYTLLVASVQASLGYKWRSEPRTWPDLDAGGVRFGSELPWSFAIGMRPGILGIDPRNRQRLEVAVHGEVPAGPVAPFGDGAHALSPVQLALSDRIEVDHYRDLFVTLGGELGLTQAVGVPIFRAVVAVGWSPRAHDLDGDGVKDDIDGCPEIPEDIDGFEDSDGCPDIDNDQDGIIDREDACPNVKGVESTDPKKNGCPGEAKPEPAKDSDGDGIDDANDKCPTQAEDKDGFEDDDGCPDPDNDADGIPDASDACPIQKGDPSADPAQNGCPNPDRDGDTYRNDEDKCPDQAEVFNGVDDNDGCPDEGGKPLVTIDEKTKRVTLAKPIKLGGTKALPEIDNASLVTLRALAAELNKHRDWTLGVGAKPASKDAEPEALAKAFAIVKVLSDFAPREDSTETVGWDAVKDQPSTDGIAFRILVTPSAKP